MNLEQLFSSLKKLTGTLEPKQLVALGLAFVAVVGVVVGSAYWMSAPTYALLASDLDAESASAVVTKLKDAKVPYLLEAGGRVIRVPTERVDELRLQLAGDGFPSAGRIGFEIFDRPAFGTTDLLEHVNYQRALEGELARTISTLSEVASARVHLALAKDSLFVDQSQPAKASVILRLKSNRPLSQATVRGIAGLVSASVELLRPDAVVILDTFGRQLSRPSEEATDAVGGVQFDREQQLERDVATRVVALLEPVVGPGHVRANVTARLSADAQEETEEKFDPTTVVRSHQSTAESDSKTALAGGVAGARANLPTPPTTPGATPAPAPAPAPIPVPFGTTRMSETTNYEVSKVTRHRISPRGQLARLSVAVIVDDEHVSTKGADGQVKQTTKPRTAPEIQRLHGLVAAAVGFDTARGDQLTVENIAFDSSTEESALPAPGVWPQMRDGLKDNWLSLTRTMGVLALALFALFGIVKPMVRRVGTTAPALVSAPRVMAMPAADPAARPPTVSELEQGMTPADSIPPPPQRRLPILTKQVAKLATDEPEQLARIVRGWLAEEEH